MPAWPIGIDAVPQMDGYSVDTPDTLLQSEMEAGIPKTRRRYTAAYEPMQVSWVMTLAQVLTFRAWLRDDLAGGAVPFDWTHPLTDAACLAMFPKSGLPSFAPHGSQWKVSATVWILP